MHRRKGKPALLFACYAAATLQVKPGEEQVRDIGLPVRAGANDAEIHEVVDETACVVRGSGHTLELPPGLLPVLAEKALDVATGAGDLHAGETLPDALEPGDLVADHVTDMILRHVVESPAERRRGEEMRDRRPALSDLELGRPFDKPGKGAGDDAPASRR